MQNVRLDDAQAVIKITRRNNNNFRHTDNTTLMAENEKELKSIVKFKNKIKLKINNKIKPKKKKKVKEESEKTG